jgi:manganese/iron transport system permease protein
MIDALFLPFQFSFMTKAFYIISIISIPTALLSCYLVLKGWSLMGDAISHSVLPGVVIAYLLNIPLIIGAFCAGMICALATGFLSENSRIKRDTVMGIVFSGMFGIGIVLYTKITTDVHLDHILFGNMLGISKNNLWTSGLVSLSISLILIAKRKDLLLHSFDPIQAQATGLPVKLIHYSLLAMISLTIVATLSAVGIILSIGLLIAPGSIAFLLTKRFEKMLIIAILVTITSGFLGVYLSFFIDSAPAPTIILILTSFFIVAFIRSSLIARQISNQVKY